jgi:hypothetical protein
MLATEHDANVQQDLHIMIDAVDQQVEGIDLNAKYLLPVQDIGQLIFGGEFNLLKDGVDAKRHPAALSRLQCYIGKAPGCTPITQLAEAQTTERLGNKALLGPYKGQVDQQLDNTSHYVDGIRQLFAKNKLDNAEGKAALDTLAQQLKDYDSWVRSTVLPHARTDFRMPEPLYAYTLKQVGIDIPPQELMKQAELEFVEMRGAMQRMAPVVAKAEGINATGYQAVFQALKKQQLPKDQVLLAAFGSTGRGTSLIAVSSVSNHMAVASRIRVRAWSTVLPQVWTRGSSSSSTDQRPSCSFSNRAV